jgi:hypothetical protein
MRPDPELARALASRAQKVVHDTVAVFRLRPASLDELVADATRRAIRFVHEDGTDRRRFPSLQKRHRTVLHLPEGGRLSNGVSAIDPRWTARS